MKALFFWRLASLIAITFPNITNKTTMLVIPLQLLSI
uniref:Uncharacterized protein n=1 Tax=Siphoviridae sp. ctX926 TaxID=2826366 RepID=A0A8S5M1B0_9CAUD|nr:MAG TPA: hypothetical protein [Siphoviridae sp. ctX926]